MSIIIANTGALPVWQNLRLWLSASAYDGAGTWRDWSGRGLDATEGTNYPSLQTNAINGRSAVRFDGTNDQLLIGSTSSFPELFDGSGMTLYMVIRRHSDTADNQAPISSHDAGDAIETGFSYIFDSTANQVYTKVGAAGVPKIFGSPGSLNTSSWRILTTIFQDGRSPNDLDTYSGTSSIKTGNSSGYGSTNSQRILRLGNGGYDRSGFLAYYAAVDIAEIMLYNAAHDATTFSEVVTYLKNKYQL